MRLVLFLLLLTTVSASCPSKEEVSPCDCIDQEGFIEVECYGRDMDQDKIKAVLNALNKADPLLLILDKVNLGSLPSSYFEGWNIIKLAITHCKLISLTSDGGKAFTGLENTLQGLDIIGSFNEGFTDGKLVLGHMNRLNDLEVSENWILNDFGKEWFEVPPPRLARLVLFDNGINNLDNKAFANLKMLQSILIEGNRFGAIQRSMLPVPANLLEELILDNNAFTSIPIDLFSNMPALKTLSLVKNGITKIEEKTFRNALSTLETVDLQENPLECDSTIDWLIKMKPTTVFSGTCQYPHHRREMELEDLLKDKAVEKSP